MQEKADQSSVNAMTLVEVYLLINFIIKKLNKKKDVQPIKRRSPQRKPKKLKRKQTNLYLTKYETTDSLSKLKFPNEILQNSNQKCKVHLS